jgi:hypothetical protein
MENETRKQLTDLERIQQSYTSGGQEYIPRAEKPSASPMQQQVLEQSKRGLQCLIPSRG